MSHTDTRKAMLRQLEAERKSHAILYVTSDRQGLGAQIGQDVIDLFVDHLDAIGPVEKISLVLYTAGGDVSAAWNLVNLIRMFCDDFEVIVPGKCMSAGTLITLGAHRTVMTKQATLGPIDPSLRHLLGPSIPGASEEARANVSVEEVNGYLDAFRSRKASAALRGQALLDLSNKVHPLVLGQIFRSRQQIRDLAQRLLHKHVRKSKMNDIINFLCSESGSHDYTINRREATELGLNIEKCSNQLYAILKSLHADFSDQLELRTPFNVNSYAFPPKSYEFIFAIIESPSHGAHHFIGEGNVETVQIPQDQQSGRPPGIVIRDQRTFEGWRKIA